MTTTHQDTTLAAGPRLFPSTQQSLVARLCSPGHAPASQDRDLLCQHYWRPVYGYLRIGTGRSNEDCKDLTQEFFLWLLDSGTLAKYNPSRGRFRSWIKLILGSFAGHQAVAARRIKRGGGVHFRPLPEDDVSLPDPKGTSPDSAFDGEWRTQLLRRAIERVRDRFQKTGREDQFRVFEEHELRRTNRTPETPSGTDPSRASVHKSLHLVRTAIREEMRCELELTTSSPAELEEEWNDLLRG